MGEEETPSDKPEEDSSSSMIDKANAAADRIEAANKEARELIQRGEAAQVETALGGTASAGKPVKKTKPVELTPEEYADKVLAGEVP